MSDFPAFRQRCLTTFHEAVELVQPHASINTIMRLSARIPLTHPYLCVVFQLTVSCHLWVLDP